MITLPATTINIGELLSNIQKMKNRDALHEIMSSIRFLCRQGLALRGDNEDGNLTQLLLMRAESDPNLKDWMKRKQNVYTSPDIQNEIIKLFGTTLLRGLVSEIQSSPFVTIMVDETTDVSNMEQATFVIRIVTEDFKVHEEFLGLYEVPSIDSKTLVAKIKDILLRMNININKVRGQCYDGASTMKGHRSGVSTVISQI